MTQLNHACLFSEAHNRCARWPARPGDLDRLPTPARRMKCAPGSGREGYPSPNPRGSSPEAGMMADRVWRLKFTLGGHRSLPATGHHGRHRARAAATRDGDLKVTSAWSR